MRILHSPRHAAAVAAAAFLLLLHWTVPATGSVVARAGLDELVAEAESIFVGEVVDVQSRVVSSRTEPTIVTEVLFRVERVLKGPERVQARLEFVGGSVGDSRVEIVGVPKFRVGDRDILFVERETGRTSALVGLAEGRFRLTRDPQTREEHVSFHDFRPVTEIGTIGTRGVRASTGRPVTRQQFEDAVRQRLQRTGR